MQNQRIVLTGFMGVGKSTVARCLSHLLRAEKIDLDRAVEEAEKRGIVEIIESDGEDHFREIETRNLQKILEETDIRIIALGGGAWIQPQNRQIISANRCTTVWLESTFDHCWRNISVSRQRRPLLNNRQSAEKLFNDRQKIYCLADWHFVVEPHLTSFDIARRIAEEIIG